MFNENLRNIKKIYSIKKYLALTIIFSSIFILLFSITNNLRLVYDLIFNINIPILNRVKILLGILPFIGLNYSTLTSSLIVITSILLAVNITILYNNISSKGGLKSSYSSFISSILAVFASGCVSCGAGLLVGIASLFGLSGAVLFLPLDGKELFFVAILIILTSIYYQSKDKKCKIS